MQRDGGAANACADFQYIATDVVSDLSFYVCFPILCQGEKVEFTANIGVFIPINHKFERCYR